LPEYLSDYMFSLNIYNVKYLEFTLDYK